MDTAVSTATLAEQINAEHAKVEQSLRSAVEHATRAGELLIQAKAQVAHGEWLPWLRANCTTVGERQARNYMRLAFELPRLPEEKRQRVADLPIRQVLAVLSEQQDPEADRVKKMNAEADDIRAQLHLCAQALDQADTIEKAKSIENWALSLEQRASDVRLQARRGLGRILVEAEAGGYKKQLMAEFARLRACSG